ncbi:alpha/beta hydrolase [Cereibacter sp. SYSU M97828]|nr:alpha/beta hydrolase [Cereibacter flavus]
MVEGHLLRDGARLHWTASGEGPPVLFQHGLGGDDAQVATLFPAGAPFCRLTLECRGHGASDAAGPYGFASFSDDLDALVAGRVMVAGGVSMGAALALRLAHLRPGLVRGLILIRPAWGAGPARGNLSFNTEAAAMIAAGAPLAGSALEARLRDTPDNLASIRGFFERPGFAPILAAMSRDDPGLSDADIAAMTMPALVLSAPRDLIHPVSLAEDLAALLPNATHATLPDKAADPAAHRAEAARAIAAFLERIDA